MKTQRENEMHLIANQLLLLVMSVFGVILIILNTVMGWEAWMTPVIVGNVVLAWWLHMSENVSRRAESYLNGFMLMFLTFYYAVHIDTVYDSTAIIVIIVFIFAFTGERALIIIGVLTGYCGLIVHLLLSYWNGTLRPDQYQVTRMVWQFALIPLALCVVMLLVRAGKEREKEYMRRIDEVEEENIRANNFLANVSHEIRTPVNAVMGLSVVLQKDGLSPAASEKVGAILDAGRRVADQIGDILDYTEIDIGRLAVNYDSYTIDSVISDLLSRHPAAETHGLDMVIDMDAATPSVLLGDATKIKKIILHLISNGFKFTAEGGVCLRVFPVEREYGINLIIEVTDTGIGMTEDEVIHIFDKFYQTDTGRSRAAGGLGLGLSIVNGFVRAMGGVLTIESTPGEGTIVRVSIPQEIIDPEPCVSAADAKDCVVAGFLGYMTTAHPRVREFYGRMISRLSEALDIPFHRVQSVQELKHLDESMGVTHLFVGTGEYLENRRFIDSLAERINVALVADQGFAGEVSPKITRVDKPFYSAQTVGFFNRTIEKTQDTGDLEMSCPGVSALVVDDEKMNLLVARGIFESYGMVVTTVQSGQEAIDICETKEFDIIFMDHMMPQMDGVEAMKRMRQSASRQGHTLCMVALTANAISSAKEMFLSEGFDGFVPKPIETAELERVLKQLLPSEYIVYEKKRTQRQQDSEGAQEAVAEEQPEEPPVEAKSSESVFFGELAACGIDTDKGLDYCMTEDFYREVLKEFADNGESRIHEIEGFYDNEDWKNYTIRVHAVKSASLTIGAVALSEEARMLELAAKEGDYATVKANHDDLLYDYRRIVENILRTEAGEAGSAGGSRMDPDTGVIEFWGD